MWQQKSISLARSGSFSLERDDALTKEWVQYHALTEEWVKYDALTKEWVQYHDRLSESVPYPHPTQKPTLYTLQTYFIYP